MIQGKKHILALMYQSPNSLEGNDQLMLDLIQSITEMNAAFKILMRDFNLPQINRNNYTTNTGVNEFGINFVEKVRDRFLTHVNEITRIGGESASNVLDLVFTNEESIVEEFMVGNPLGRSDHAVLQIMVLVILKKLAPSGIFKACHCKSSFSRQLPFSLTSPVTKNCISRYKLLIFSLCLTYFA